MIAAVLLGAATPSTAIAADRAFAAAAQHDGQWTAFRAFADPGAVMFPRHPANALALLRDFKDPPQSARWRPAASYVACDGRWAADHGALEQADGSRGYYTDIWHRDPSGWRFVLVSGATPAEWRPAPARPRVRHAACGGSGRGTLAAAGADTGVGASDDATLRWRYAVDAAGVRTVEVELWNGRRYDTVIDDHVAAPPQ